MLLFRGGFDGAELEDGFAGGVGVVAEGEDADDQEGDAAVDEGAHGVLFGLGYWGTVVGAAWFNATPLREKTAVAASPRVPTVPIVGARAVEDCRRAEEAGVGGRRTIRRGGPAGAGAPQRGMRGVVLAKPGRSIGDEDGAVKTIPVTVAVVQASPVWMDRAATIEKACALVAQAAAQGARLVAFPESFIPAFPYGVWHHGMHRNMAFHKALMEAAVELPARAPGPQALTGDLAPLAAAVRAAGAHVVMGLTEKSGGSLYNTQAFIGADGMLLGARRKLKPTSAERLVWGEGDGSGMRVFETPYGRLGGLMCGEHNFALARYTLQALGEQIHVASYPDPLMEGRPFADRLEAAVRHYAAEGQCFVLNATGFIDDAIRAAVFDTPAARAEIGGADAMNGASSIIAPDGRVLAGPLSGREGILTAQIDVANTAYAKYWFDAAGHSGRGDIFRLEVDFSERPALHAAANARREVRAPAGEE